MIHGRAVAHTAVLTFLLAVAFFGAAEAATEIPWDGNLPGGDYDWFDAANWSGGEIPDAEGESPVFNWARIIATVDLDGDEVDVVGSGADPGLMRIQGTRATGLLTIVDGAGSGAITVSDLRVHQWGNAVIEVPVTVTNELVVDYRGAWLTQKAALDAPVVRIGKGDLTLDALDAGTHAVNNVTFFDDRASIAWGVTGRMTVNGPLAGLTGVTVDYNGDYIANSANALGTGQVDILSGTVTVGVAQTTFPDDVTVGTDTWPYCALAGDLTGADYAVAGNVAFVAGAIVGDTSGGGNNPTRAEAGGATLYQPIGNVAAGQTHLSGDDGSGPYRGVALGPWSSSDTVEATLQARPGSGNLQVAIAGRAISLGETSVWQSDGTITTADVKVFPGRGQINLSQGGINANAITAGTPDLITTFNIAGVPGDLSPDWDKISGDEKWTIVESSGTGRILPGQTVSITNGLYTMRTVDAVETVGGTLQIGEGGTLEVICTEPLAEVPVPPPPLGTVQSTATGRLEMQDRGLLVIPAGDSLGSLSAAQVSTSGTPVVCFTGPPWGTSFNRDWVAEVTIDEVVNPGLATIMAASDIVLHCGYHVADEVNAYRRNKFLGDGLRVRSDGIVMTTADVYGNPSPDCGIHAETEYFGPAVEGDPFTLAAFERIFLNIYCPVTAAGSTITVGSDTEIESFWNTGWYPYHTEYGRILTIPTGSVVFHPDINGDSQVACQKIVIKSGSVPVQGNGLNGDDIEEGIFIEGGRVDLGAAGTLSMATVTTSETGYLWVTQADGAIGTLFLDDSEDPGLVLQDQLSVSVNRQLGGAGSWADEGSSNVILTEDAVMTPGRGVGILTGKNLTLQSGAVYEWELGDPDEDPGSGWDLVVLDGLDLQAGWVLRLKDAGVTRAPAADDAFDLFIVSGAPFVGTVVFDETVPPGWDTTNASVEVDGDRVYVTGLNAVSSGSFRRGDVNADATVNIADAIALLGHLFSGEAAPPCRDAADTNDDGQLNIADAIAALGHLFGGAGPLPDPFAACGTDPTDDALDCVSFPPCP